VGEVAPANNKNPRLNFGRGSGLKSHKNFFHWLAVRGKEHYRAATPLRLQNNRVKSYRASNIFKAAFSGLGAQGNLEI
jgi:hypothetical protein